MRLHVLTMPLFGRHAFSDLFAVDFEFSVAIGLDGLSRADFKLRLSEFQVGRAEVIA